MGVIVPAFFAGVQGPLFGGDRMKIGIDLRHAAPGDGLSVLLKGALERLFVLHPEDDYVVFCTAFNRGLLEPPARGNVLTLPLEGYYAQLGRVAADQRLDVLFRGAPDEAELAVPLPKQVFLVPDLRHEHLPGPFPVATLPARRAAFSLALLGAGAIGTVSEFVRRALLDQPCTRCTDVFLMSPALPTEQGDPEQLTPAERANFPKGDFFLCPANLSPHKNHARVLEAFARFQARVGQTTELVFTGRPDGWEALARRHPTLPIRHLGFVRPPVLRRLFLRTKALVFFSLYEGFGLPLLEAFDAGAPVLCSNTTGLAEVGGEAVLPCDPTDVEAMSRLMERICQSSALRADLAERGRRRLALYSWEPSALNLHAALKRVAEAPADAPVTVFATPRGTTLPVVSIVTPSYNQGRFLRRTIESVLSQSYPHIDYRVVDGGSTDDSVAILESYGTRFPWVSERDRGQTHAINKGLAQARGEVLAYLNSDDVLLPGAVEKVVDYLLHRPQCDLVYGQGWYIDEQDNRISQYATADYALPRLLRDCCICQPAAFWRASIARRVGPFEERRRFAMDYDYWLRIARAGGRIEHWHQPLACSRWYPDTKTLAFRVPVYREIIQTCLERADFAHPVYFRGLWHHLCEEKWLLRHLARLPHFEETMASLHHLVANGKYRPIPRLVAKITRGAEKLFKKWKRAVVGFGGDNWLAPVASIWLKDRPADEPLYLSGIAPVDMDLVVTISGEGSHRFKLHGNALETVTLPSVAAGEGKRVVLKFSGYAVTKGRRKVSFLVQDTNLFAEQDAG